MNFTISTATRTKARALIIFSNFQRPHPHTSTFLSHQLPVSQLLLYAAYAKLCVESASFDVPVMNADECALAVKRWWQVAGEGIQQQQQPIEIN